MYLRSEKLSQHNDFNSSVSCIVQPYFLPPLTLFLRKNFAEKKQLT